MARHALELGPRYFCREETTGEGYCGMFLIEEKDIAVQLFAFDKMVGPVFGDLLVLRLENNQVVSLHNTVNGGASTTSRHDGKVLSSSRRVISNIAVIGHDAWASANPIRRVQFNIAHADDLMLHSDKFNAIADAEFSAMPELPLFELKIGGVRVKVWYPTSGSVAFKRPTTIGVRFEIEFDEPAILSSYLEIVECVVRFVSAALGHRFGPSEIEISRLSTADLLKAMEERNATGDHSVYYIWPVTELDNSLWVGNSFAHVRYDKELADFIACLRSWIERDADWKDATNLMMGALALSGVMSGERLLTACKWLEEIPGAASAIAVSPEDIEAIASIAAAEAERLGHKDYKDRIAGVIRGQLKTESYAERFTRLRQAVCDRFDEKALDADVVSHLMKAIQFRGKVAHGHYEPDNQDDYKAFVKAVYAMEGLCYLLTLKDLPMSAAGAKRTLGQQITANYCQCIY
jgi:hypothetical protein